MIDANNYTIHHLTKYEFYNIIEALKYAKESAMIRNDGNRMNKYQQIANIVFDKTTSVMKPDVDLRAWLSGTIEEIIDMSGADFE